MATIATPSKAKSTLFQTRINAKPSQPYSNLVKVVLKKRLRHMFIITGLAAYSILLVVVFDPKALPGSLFNFLSVLFYAPLAFLGAIPILVLRKQTLTTISKNYPSRFARFIPILTPPTLSVFSTYLLGSVPIFSAYLYCTATVSNEPKLGLFFSLQGREFQQVNERRLLLTLLHLFLVGFSTFDHIFQQRSRIQFDKDSTLTIPARLSSKALARLPSLVRSTLVSNAIFYSTYLLLRQSVLRLLLQHVVSVWSRPYLYSIYHSNAALSITLATRALASTFLTLGIWEVANICFDIYSTQPMTVSQFAPNPNLSLITGLSSTEDYFRHFAFLELSLISCGDSRRRKDIFMDIKRDAPESGAWAEISKECLKLIEEGMDLVQKRGEMPKTKPIDSSNSTSSIPGLSKPVEGNVFLPVKKSIFDTLSSTATAPIPKIPIKIPIAISTALSNTPLISRVPAIFQSNSTPTIVELPKSKENIKLEPKLEDWIPSRFRGVMFGEIFGKRSESTVSGCVLRKTELIWAIRALSNFLVVSITEDPYGVAQPHLPKILESLVLFLTSLENLSISLESSVGESQKEEMKLAIIEHVTPIENTVREGCRDLMTVFKKYEGNGLDLPPIIASKLKLLVDWG